MTSYFNYVDLDGAVIEGYNLEGTQSTARNGMTAELSSGELVLSDGVGVKGLLYAYPHLHLPWEVLYNDTDPQALGDMVDKAGAVGLVRGRFVARMDASYFATNKDPATVGSETLAIIYGAANGLLTTDSGNDALGVFKGTVTANHEGGRYGTTNTKTLFEIEFEI